MFLYYFKCENLSYLCFNCSESSLPAQDKEDIYVVKDYYNRTSPVYRMQNVYSFNSQKTVAITSQTNSTLGFMNDLKF